MTYIPRPMRLLDAIKAMFSTSRRKPAPSIEDEVERMLGSIPEDPAPTRAFAKVPPLRPPDTRAKMRVPLDQPCALKPHAAGKPPRIAARVLDVSTSGARVVAPWGLTAGDELRHVLSLPGDLDATAVEARVVWSTSKTTGVEMGLVFVDLPGSMHARIDELVRTRFREIHRLSILLSHPSIHPSRRREIGELARTLGFPEGGTDAELRAWASNLQALFEDGRSRLLS